MALRTGFLDIHTSSDWKEFFQEELNLSPDTAENYGDELASQNITGNNIIIGLAEPGFLNQFNMTIGHQLELKTKFSVNANTKGEFSNNCPSPRNKIPTPVVNLNISRLEFDQFIFEWQKYKEHYNIRHNVATSLFFCCSEDVRQQIRIHQTSQNLEWTEQTLLEAIKDTVLSKTSSIVHVKQFLEIKQGQNESVQAFLQRLQAKASCCTFLCSSCNTNITEDRVKEKFILGLSDTLTQRSVLRTESIKPGTALSDLLTEALTLEQSAREQESLASRAGSDNTVCSMYDSSDEIQVNALARNKEKLRSCTHCGSSDHSAFERREKCPAWGKRCNNCQTLHHFKNMCLKPRQKKQTNLHNSVNFAEVLCIGEIGSEQLPVTIRSEGSNSCYCISAFPDTGATICLMGPSQLRHMKIKLSDLNPCYKKIYVVGGSSITSTGWLDVEIAIGENQITSRV